MAWGLLHGAGLLVYRGWRTLAWPLPWAIAWTLTFLFVVVGWVLFRASTFAMAGHMLAGLVGGGGLGGRLEQPMLLAMAAAVSVLGPTTRGFVTEMLKPVPAMGVLIGLLAAAIVLETGKGQPVTFIYFQF